MEATYTNLIENQSCPTKPNRHYWLSGLTLFTILVTAFYAYSSVISLLRHEASHVQLSSVVAPAQVEELRGDRSYRITAARAIDGDTVAITAYVGLDTSRDVIVRLPSLDAIERYDPAGDRAKAYVAKWLESGRLHLLTDERRDKYGRIIGEIINADGQALSQAVIDAGFSKPAS